MGQVIGGDLQEASGVSFAFWLFIAFIFLLLYFMKKRKWFIIEYAGGEIITSCNWYSDNSLKKFMRAVYLQKDKCN